MRNNKWTFLRINLGSLKGIKMASEIVGELRRGTGTVTRGDKGRLNVTMQIDFLVVTDDKFTSREEVLLATANAPIVGLNYGPLGIPCVSKTATRNETNPLYWELSCQFDSAVENQEPNPENPENPDPTLWIPIWKLDLSIEDGQSYPVDQLGNSIKNTANEFYDPLPTRKHRLISWTFNQFEQASTTAVEISNRHMTVNNAPLVKIMRGQRYEWDQYAFLMSIEDAELGYYAGFLCWNIKYRLTYKRNMQPVVGGPSENIGWQTVYYSRGYNYLQAGELQPWMSKGTNINGPLDSVGAKAALNSPGHKQLFLFYEPSNWSAFLR